MVYEARGHHAKSDGTLMVDGTATSDADPATFSDVVPERRIGADGDPEHPDKSVGDIIEAPRSYTICSCGVIDYNKHDSRTRKQLVEAVENIADRFKEITARDDEIQLPFDEQAAIDLIDERGDNGELGRNDDHVLADAIACGREAAEEATTNGDE